MQSRLADYLHRICDIQRAERAGFEPAKPLGTRQILSLVPFTHSATSPLSFQTTVGIRTGLASCGQDLLPLRPLLTPCKPACVEKNANNGRNGNGNFVQLKREEIVACLEKEARRRCGISAQKLLQLDKRGKLRDRGTVADLLSLARLLRKNDPIFAE
jgi:hypothetical protein